LTEGLPPSQSCSANMSTHPMVINGELVQAEGGATVPVINPATGAEFDTVPDASSADVERAVASAKAAFLSWSTTPFADRSAALIKFADLMEESKTELSEALTREQGKPIGFATWEIGATIDKARDMAKAENGDLVPEEYEQNDKGRCVAHFEPRGVVVGITPWNFPVLMAANKLFPSVITGNTIVLKPSPYTPLATVMLAQMAQQAFPAGVVNIITGGNSTGQALVEHPDVKMVSFTGSTATGKKIMATCAGTLKKVVLEMGGNDAAIVLPDSDVAAIAPTIFGKAMFNTGQVCVALKRLYVHSSQYDQMVDLLKAKAESATLGDGMEPGVEYGPLNNKMQLERVEELVNQARDSGARIVAGGQRVQPTGSEDAYFYAPTIIADVSDEARIVCEEQFGPALPVLKYDEIDDAVARANDTDYGLGASVWGTDPLAAAKVGARLQAGSIWINSHLGSGLDIDAPFGGIKESGIGQEGGGKAGLKAFCDQKFLYIPHPTPVAE